MKKLLLVMILILAVPFVSAECIDSDGGVDYNNAGYATVGPTTYWDSCKDVSGNPANTGVQLKEYYCRSGLASSTIKDCDCRYGRCFTLDSGDVGSGESGGTTTPACVNNDHKECYGNNVYWYDSCGSMEAVAQYCGANQYCDGAECKSKCGNGQCDSGEMYVCKEDCDWCGDGECTSNENCGNCYADCKCASYERCNWGRCEGYCGNGRADSGETCSSCPYDVKCSSYERCWSGECQTYCGNGRCDSNENCASCANDCGCASSEECVQGSCKSKCGNNRVDPGEDCASCQKDAGCSPGTYCFNSMCVQCLNDNHCDSKETYGGEFICGPGHLKVLEKGIKMHGVCRNNQCTGEKTPITKIKEDCGQRFCQDGHCGCSEEYEACTKSGKCEKQRTLKENNLCNCDFQCKSGYCSDKGICLDVLNVVLSSTKNSISVKEETTVTLSADNNLNQEINLNVALDMGDGVSMSNVISGMHCSGNQCKISKKIPARGREEVTVGLLGQSANEVKMTAQVNYILGDGKERSVSDIDEMILTVIDCGDGKCTEGETTNNCCIDCKCPADEGLYGYSCKKDNSCKKSLKSIVYINVGLALLTLIIIYLVGKHGIGFYEKRKLEWEKKNAENEKEEKVKKEEEEKQRVKVKAMLKHLKNKIKPDKIPSEEGIRKYLEKHMKKINETILDEEYLRFVEEIEAKKKEEGSKLKFCPKCGEELREGAKFCPKCGASLKR